MAEGHAKYSGETSIRTPLSKRLRTQPGEEAFRNRSVTKIKQDVKRLRDKENWLKIFSFEKLIYWMQVGVRISKGYMWVVKRSRSEQTFDVVLTN